MQITWKASEIASALQIAGRLTAGRARVDDRVSGAVTPLLQQLPRIFPAGDAAGLLAMLSQQVAAGCEQHHELAQLTLRKLTGPSGTTDAAISQLSAWLANLKWTVGQARPSGGQPLADELLLRAGPLRDQWDARGPGMMRAIAQMTEPWFVAEQAQVMLVLPVMGGHGVAHLPVNAVTIEAMLTNADDALPEVVRLVWLIAQLQFDLPLIADLVPPGQRERLARWAALPPALAAAQRVELIADTEASFARAALAWHLVETEPEAKKGAGTLATWWQTYQAGATSWPVAVAALGQMLSP